MWLGTMVHTWTHTQEVEAGGPESRDSLGYKPEPGGDKEDQDFGTRETKTLHTAIHSWLYSDYPLFDFLNWFSWVS